MRWIKIVQNLTVSATVVCACVAATAHAETSAASKKPYPSQPIRIVDAYPAGGSSDYLARQIAHLTGPDWNTPIIVENRSGAAGQIGTGSVTRARPDGYTLLVVPNELWTAAPTLYGSRLPYDTHAQLMPVSPVTQAPLVMSVHPSLPVSSVQEFLEYIKAHPEKATYGSGGVGSIHNLAAEQFAAQSGVPMIHVPYQGTAPAVNDLLGGQISVVFTPISAALPHVRAGKLKALAVTGASRSNALPDVPTVVESGLPDYTVISRVSLLAPRGTPEPIVQKWFEQVRKVITSDSVRNALADQGIEPDVIGYDDWVETLARDSNQWKTVIEQANIRVE